ncbi:MAG: amidase family protein [Mycoplasmoidaceae bacterium]|nr:MAG: amidase family protein [Mycoplasmoidaceae bacterium]
MKGILKSKNNMDSKILELQGQFQNKKTTPEIFINTSLKLLKKYESTTLAFNPKAINDAKNINIANSKNNLLSGIPYTLKDLFCTNGIHTTAGSKILENYNPMFDSTIYSKLNAANSIMLAKSNLDEFGMGGSGLLSAYKPIINPFNQKNIVGGSTSGGAVQVALDIVPFTIGTDTADSVRSVATYMGIIGFKPTYGVFSRHGVISYAPSLDTVGIMAKYVKDVAIVASVICGKDEKDITSTDYIFSHDLKSLNKINIAIIDGIEKYLPAQEKKIYLSNIDTISKKFNVIKRKFDIKYIELINPTYMILSYAEASSTFSNYSSIPFGEGDKALSYDKRVSSFRSKKFSNNVKKKLFMGALFCDNEINENLYSKAKKIRTVLINEFNNLMSGVDCLITPGSSMFAPTIKQLKDKTFNKPQDWYVTDLLCLANFAGTPSLSLPTYINKEKNFGININAKQYSDNDLLNIGYTIESLLK